MPPTTPYRPPITKAYTIKIIRRVAIFMISGSLLMAGLNILAAQADNYLKEHPSPSYQENE
jgi:hypothetical protein